MLTNIGLNSTLLIFLAEKGKCRENDHNIIISFSIILTIAILISFTAIYFNQFIILFILNIPIKFYLQIKILFILLVLSNAILFIGQVFSSILDSMQKMYISNFYQLLYNILYNSLIIISLLIWMDFVHIGISIFISALIWFMLMFYSANKFWGKIDYSDIGKTFIPLLKKQTSLGLKVYFSSLVFFFYEPLTKLLLSHFMGYLEVGFFDIALKIRNQIWGLISKASQPLLPLISGSNDKVQIRNLVHDLEQKTFFLVLPVVVIAVFCTKPIISLWIGGEYVNTISITTFFITAIYLLFSSTMIPMYNYLMSKGHAEKTIYIQLTNSVINIIFIFLLYNPLGFYSFVISYSLAIISSFLLMLYYQKIILNSLIFDNLQSLIKLGIVFAINLTISYILQIIILNYVLQIITISLQVFVCTIWLYRILEIFKIQDIKRYFGADNNITKTLIKILLKKNSY